ncbi:DUF4178 domain-containing protein [Rufibacter soli]
MNGFKLIEKEQLPGTLEVACPSCKKKLHLITHAQAKNVVCPHCSHLSELQEKGLVPIQSVGREKQEPLLPIGRKGRINGVLYAVVGFLVFKERNLKYRWREYVLFNPVQGYAFLAESDGHWTFFRFISDFINGNKHISSDIRYLDKNFKLYNKYRTTVTHASGEFFWQITEDENQYSEYVAAPYMLTMSIGREEQSYMFGEHMEPELVQELFSLDGPMPYQIGVGGAEPFSQDFPFPKVRNLALVAAAVLLGIQVLLSVFHQNKVLLDKTYLLTEEEGKGTLMALPGPTIDIESSLLGSTNLEVRLRAPVENSWFATGISLLNTKTGREYYVEVGVEFYNGVEGGESWSEGSPDTDQILSAIPSGTYQVYLQPSRDMQPFQSGVPDTFHLRLVQDVPIWSNFWISLLLLAAVPAVQGFREYSFERSRWMSSDYSPYDE